MKRFFLTVLFLICGSFCFADRYPTFIAKKGQSVTSLSNLLIEHDYKINIEDNILYTDKYEDYIKIFDEYYRLTSRVFFIENNKISNENITFNDNYFTFTKILVLYSSVFNLKIFPSCCNENFVSIYLRSGNRDIFRLVYDNLGDGDPEIRIARYF